MSAIMTAFMIYNQFARLVGRNLGELSKVQDQISSGKRLTKPSDDVIAMRGSMAYKVSINNIEQYGRNINEGLSALGLTGSLLGSANNILNRARELAISESSDTSTSDTRKITSYEVQNLFNELIDIGNTKLKDRYLFSGYLASTQAFSAAGAYQGDSNDINIHINEGITSKINVTGDSAFSDTTKLTTSSAFDLDSETMAGTLTFTVGSANPVSLPIKDGATAASPEEIRDAINAPMSKWYALGTTTVGTGKLTFKVGTSDAVSIDVNATNANTTVSTLVSYINSNVTGIEARVATDTTTNQQRIFFRPTTAGTTYSIEASDDDGDNEDTSGLSALMHTDIKSNLTENALGVEAFVINGTSGKRMVIDSTVEGTTFTISAADNDGDNTDLAGLSHLYHASTAASNLYSATTTNNTLSFFNVMDHMKNSLSNNDDIGIRQTIHLLDGSLDGLVNTTADVGSRLKYFEGQVNRLEDNQISYSQSLSILEDADIAKVALEITKIQTTLEAMRIASIKGLSQSLFDFIG